MTFLEVDALLYEHLRSKRELDPDWRSRRDELTAQWLRLCLNAPSGWDKIKALFDVDHAEPDLGWPS